MRPSSTAPAQPWLSIFKQRRLIFEPNPLEDESHHIPDLVHSRDPLFFLPTALFGAKGVFTQKAPKPETLKGLRPGHLPTAGRRALWGSYDFLVVKGFESHFPGGNQLWKCLRLRGLWCECGVLGGRRGQEVLSGGKRWDGEAPLARGEGGQDRALFRI